MKGELRWNCQTQGCYAVKSKPKLELFSDVLPGKIAPSDLDSVIEIAGNFLLMEFKDGDERPLPTGQRILIERFTQLSPKVTAVVVYGNTETGDVRAVTVCKAGRWWPVESCNLSRFRERIANWAEKSK